MEEKWGVGNRAEEKAFDKVKLQSGDELELIFGEHPHSRRDKNIYARRPDNPKDITGFDGHRRPVKIVVEEYNYLKSSEMSGDEIRKGGNVKVYINDVLCLEEFCRNYERGYKIANNFIEQIFDGFSVNFPDGCDEWVGKTISYREQPFIIESFIVSQACMILKTPDGKTRKKFTWEDYDDLDDEPTTVKVSILDDAITWYPKFDKVT
jgi:hypothetical protein